MERFNPADANNCLQEGEVQLQIYNCVATKSKKTDKDMLKFTFKAKDDNGKICFVTYFAMEVLHIKKIFECFALDMEKFNSGYVPASYYVSNNNILGKGIVKTRKNQNGEDESAIYKFLKHESLNMSDSTLSDNKPVFNDDIPF
jgi:hypothetical protein